MQRLLRFALLHYFYQYLLHSAGSLLLTLLVLPLDHLLLPQPTTTSTTTAATATATAPCSLLHATAILLRRRGRRRRLRLRLLLLLLLLLLPLPLALAFPLYTHMLTYTHAYILVAREPYSSSVRHQCCPLNPILSNRRPLTSRCARWEAAARASGCAWGVRTL